MDDEVPILDEENYSTWRIEMRLHLKTMGEAIWKATIGGSVSLKNKSKFVAQREGKKNDALALKTILSGLSSPIKESMGQCTSTKDLWLKLEETYQARRRKKILKITPSRSLKVKNLQKLLNALFLNVILKTFQVKIMNQVMIAQRKILKTFQMKANNYVLMLAKRKIVKIFQMKVKNPQKPLISMMMMNFSLQVKKKM
jgi:hypothetical protein